MTTITVCTQVPKLKSLDFCPPPPRPSPLGNSVTHQDGQRLMFLAKVVLMNVDLERAGNLSLGRVQRVFDHESKL